MRTEAGRVKQEGRIGLLSSLHLISNFNGDDDVDVMLMVIMMMMNMVIVMMRMDAGTTHKKVGLALFVKAAF